MIILTIIMVLLLVGCSKQQVSDDEAIDSIPGFPETVDGMVLPADNGDLASIGDDVEGRENIEKLNDIMSLSEKTRVFPSNKKVNKGNSYQFAVGFGNHLNKPRGLQIHTTFKNAMSGMSNELVVDVAEIQKWVANDIIYDVEVGAGDVEVLLLNIAVPEEDVQKGSYTFTVRAYTAESVQRDRAGWDEYGKFDFVVIVS